MVNSLKDDATQSYLVRFKTTLEQATVVHPIVEVSELDPGKTIIDGKLGGLLFLFFLWTVVTAYL